MNIGQAIKATLNEFSQSTPTTKKWFGSNYHALKITVHPKFIRTAEELIQAGLKHLAMGDVTVMEEGDIYLYFLSKQPIDLPPIFFQETLPIAINTVINAFAQNWTKTEPTPSSVISVIYEHEFEKKCPRFDNILWSVVNSISAEDLKILNRPWGSKIAISGTSEEKIIKCINSILPMLSPLHAEQMQLIPSLNTMCQSVILQNYSLFSNVMKKIPDDLQWLALKSVNDVTPFAGKIVLFKVTTAGFSTYRSYSIHPDRKDIMVGLIDDRCTQYAYDEMGYDFKTLLITDGSGYMHTSLRASNLKYSDFHVRLPDLSELHAIDAALSSRKANIGLNYYFYPLIQAQMNEIRRDTQECAI